MTENIIIKVPSILSDKRRMEIAKSILFEEIHKTNVCDKTVTIELTNGKLFTAYALLKEECVYTA